MNERKCRCKLCGNVQIIGLDQCGLCHADLTLGGAEPIVEADSSTGGKRKFPLWISIALGLLVAAVVVALLLRGKNPDSQPTQPTGASTVPSEPTESPEAPTAPSTEPSTEPTTAPTTPEEPEVIGCDLILHGLFWDDKNNEERLYFNMYYTIGYDVEVAFSGSKPGEVDVQVTSSDESILRVDPESRTIYACGHGFATITATAGDCKDEVKLQIRETEDTDLKLGTTVDKIQVCGTEPVDVQLQINAYRYGERISTTATTSVICHTRGITWENVMPHTKINDDPYTTASTLKFTIDPTQFTAEDRPGILIYRKSKTDDPVVDKDFIYIPIEIVDSPDKIQETAKVTEVQLSKDTLLNSAGTPLNEVLTGYVCEYSTKIFFTGVKYGEFDVQYTSTNTGVLLPMDSGLVVAAGSGTATVTCRVGGVSDSETITVLPTCDTVATLELDTEVIQITGTEPFDVTIHRTFYMNAHDFERFDVIRQVAQGVTIKSNDDWVKQGSIYTSDMVVTIDPDHFKKSGQTALVIYLLVEEDGTQKISNIWYRIPVEIPEE